MFFQSCAHDSAKKILIDHAAYRPAHVLSVSFITTAVINVNSTGDVKRLRVAHRCSAL